MNKLIPFSGMVDENWEIFVIEDPSEFEPRHLSRRRPRSARH